jgi:hypothetical protein
MSGQRTNWTREQYEAYLRRSICVPNGTGSHPFVAPAPPRKKFSGPERKLKDLVLLELNRRGAWVFEQRMDKATRGRPGVPDIVGCLPPGGRLFGIEIKTGSRKMTDAQISESIRIEAAGGAFVCAYCLEDVLGMIKSL